MKKYYRVTNQNTYGGFSRNDSFSIVSVETKENYINISTVKGINLTIGGLFEILKQFPRELKKAMCEVGNMAEYGYKKHIREGMSGCRTFSLTYITDMIGYEIPYRRTKQVFHETCFGKLEDGRYEEKLSHILFFLPEIAEEEKNDIEVRELKEIDMSDYTTDISDISKIVLDMCEDVEFTYIEGMHESGETYTWEVPEGVDIHVGDSVTVETCYGNSTVEVKKVFVSNKDLGHKKVI